jgi:hypothetical protein
MTLDLAPERMQATLNKNLATSYGLTLVLGLPFPRPLLVRTAQLWEQVEALLPGRFRWYAPDHLHATVMAPLRGRYREAPPLQRHELPADLARFTSALNDCFSALRPFRLEMDSLHLKPDGRLLALGADLSHVRQRVAECLASFPEMDRPKDLAEWHATIGYLQTPEPFTTEAERAGFEVGWSELEASSLGEVEVERVWLVHYADRTLSRIEGKIPLLLGRPNTLTPDSLLAALGIGL